MADTVNNGMDLEGLAQRIQALEDRTGIVEAIVRYANALDSCDYSEMRSLLLDEVRMDFAFMALEPQVFAADDWVAFAETALSGLRCTHHISPNHVLQRLEGDEATCLSYMYAQHWLPNDRGGDEFLMRGHYVNELRRTPDGWKIAAMKQVTTWTSGNPGLFALVMGDTREPGATPRRR